MIATHAVPMPMAADLAKRRAWVEEVLTSATILPLSFIPTSEIARSNQAHRVWQVDRPERGHGFLQAIRFPAALQASFTFYPQGIDPAAHYRFELAETGECQELSEQGLLRDGFAVTLPARSGAIWFYQSTNR